MMQGTKPLLIQWKNSIQAEGLDWDLGMELNPVF